MQLHVIVHGRVQGVGFRWFVREAARRRDLGGWVRNLEDGSVEVMVEGNDADVAFLEEQLRRGPRGAGVERLEAMSSEPGNAPRPFAILR